MRFKYVSKYTTEILMRDSRTAKQTYFIKLHIIRFIYKIHMKWLREPFFHKAINTRDVIVI